MASGRAGRPTPGRIRCSRGLGTSAAGLDPVNAARLDGLILQLRDHLGTTVVMVTHEVDSIFAVADRALYLDEEEKTMIALAPPQELLAHGPAPVRAFLRRGRNEPALGPQP